jgi:hypothetical protein
MGENEDELMESDDRDDMDIMDLDLQSIVEACSQKETNSIPSQQLQILKEALWKNKVKQSTHTGKISSSLLGV